MQEGDPLDYTLPTQVNDYSKITVSWEGITSDFVIANSDATAFSIEQGATLGLDGNHEIILKVTWDIEKSDGSISKIDGEYSMKFTISPKASAEDEYEEEVANAFEGFVK